MPRHIACLSYDFDTWSGFAARGMTTPTPISRGEFGVVVQARGHALHDAGRLLAARLGGSDDFRLGQAQFVAPALDVQPGGPALPPAGQSGGVQAQRCQQVPENLIGNRLARLRALLLLYWFT